MISAYITIGILCAAQIVDFVMLRWYARKLADARIAVSRSNELIAIATAMLGPLGSPCSTGEWRKLIDLHLPVYITRRELLEKLLEEERKLS